MGNDKKIKFGQPGEGNTTEKVEDATSVDCVGQNDGDHMAIIVSHESGPNTVIEPVTDMFSVEDI